MSHFPIGPLSSKHVNQVPFSSQTPPLKLEGGTLKHRKEKPKQKEKEERRWARHSPSPSSLPSNTAKHREGEHVPLRSPRCTTATTTRSNHHHHHSSNSNGAPLHRVPAENPFFDKSVQRGTRRASDPSPVRPSTIGIATAPHESEGYGRQAHSLPDCFTMVGLHTRPQQRDPIPTVNTRSVTNTVPRKEHFLGYRRSPIELQYLKQHSSNLPTFRNALYSRKITRRREGETKVIFCLGRSAPCRATVQNTKDVPLKSILYTTGRYPQRQKGKEKGEEEGGGGDRSPVMDKSAFISVFDYDTPPDDRTKTKETIMEPHPQQQHHSTHSNNSNINYYKETAQRRLSDSTSKEEDEAELQAFLDHLEQHNYFQHCVDEVERKRSCSRENSFDRGSSVGGDHPTLFPTLLFPSYEASGVAGNTSLIPPQQSFHKSGRGTEASTNGSYAFSTLLAPHSEAPSMAGAGSLLCSTQLTLN